MTRAKLTILVVGINYAPEHTGIAPYTTAAAEHLAAMGHEVTVFAGIPHYPSWSVAKEDRWHLGRSETCRGVHVRRLRHFVPRSQDAVRRALYEATFAAQVLFKSRSIRPDVVITVVPSLLSGLAAWRIARRNRAEFIVWLQDSMSAAASQSGMPGGRQVAGAVAVAEKSVLIRAGAVLVVSSAFADHTRRVGVDPERIVTMPNWVHVLPPTRERAEVRRELGWADGDIIVLHSGNMGLKQDLERVVEAGRLGLTVAPAVRFVLMGDGSQRAALQAQAESVASISLMDSSSAQDYSNVLLAADILLINERQGVTDMSLPSKLTSYLASGRPVVAAVAPHGATAVELERSGGGLVTTDQTPEALLSAVLAVNGDAELAQVMGQDGQRYALAELSETASLSRLDQLVTPTVSEQAVA